MARSRLVLYDPERIDGKVGESLFHALVVCGYIPLLNSLDARRYPQNLLEKISPGLDIELQAVCGLLCFGKRTSVDRLPKILQGPLLDLVPSGLARMSGGCLSIAPLALYVVGGLLYFAEMPNPLISLYFGEDSIALATRLNLFGSKRGRALDICSGPGIQGLLASSAGYEVTAVEVNPVAASLSRCNAKLNGCFERYKVEVCSFENFLKLQGDRRFDKIFANPPLVPIPDQCQYLFVGAGGIDGLAVSNSIVHAAPRLLKPYGELTTIGVSGGDESGPFILDTLDEVMKQGGFCCTLAVLRRFSTMPDSVWVSKVSSSLNLYSIKRDGFTPERVSALYRKTNVTRVYFYALSVTAPASEEDRSLVTPLRLADISPFNDGAEAWWM